MLPWSVPDTKSITMTQSEREGQLWERAVNTHLENYLHFPDGKPFRVPCRARSYVDVLNRLVELNDAEGNWLRVWGEGDWPADRP